MKVYKSFNEMAMGTGSLDPGVREGMAQFVDNMSPKLTSIPPFHGKHFYVWAHEIAHGGKPEKPHVHINLPEGEVKCWISEGPNRNTVKPEINKSHKIENSIVRAVVDHLQNNWEDVAREWNSFIDENYPKFSNDEQCKIPINGN